jgi:hypothetical protein
MGYNTHKFDNEAHYASKSTKQLQEMLKEAQGFIQRHPKLEQGMPNEYVHDLKRRIAERVGRK